MRLLIDTGLDSIDGRRFLGPVTIFMVSDGQDKSMIALAHRLCLGNAEGCDQRMLRMVAYGHAVMTSTRMAPE